MQNNGIQEYITKYKQNIPSKDFKEVFIGFIRDYQATKDKRIIDNKIAPIALGLFLRAYKSNNKITYGYDLDESFGYLYEQIIMSCSRYNVSAKFLTSPSYYFVRAMTSKMQGVYLADKRNKERYYNSLEVVLGIEGEWDFGTDNEEEEY